MARDPAPVGNPHKKILNFQAPTENYSLLRPTLKKKIALAFLKAASPYNPNCVHFIFKVQNPIHLFTFIE